MKKRRAVGLIAALGLLLGGCGANPLAREPEKLQQADGSFGLSEVSLGLRWRRGNREGSGRIAEGAGAGKQRGRFL